MPAMQKDTYRRPPERPAGRPPAGPHVGWRELLAREHLPRLLTLCLAIWLHAANSMLAATTMPEAVHDIGGLRLISWAFALYMMGSIVAAAGDQPVRGELRPAQDHDGLDPGLHPRLRGLRRRTGDAGAACRAHGAGARRRCARRSGLHRPGPLLPEPARAAHRRLPVGGVDGVGTLRTADRRCVRHRRPVAFRLLVVRVAGPAARGGGAPVARQGPRRRGVAGAADSDRAAVLHRWRDPLVLVRRRGGGGGARRRAPAGGMRMPRVVRRARRRRRMDTATAGTRDRSLGTRSAAASP